MTTQVPLPPDLETRLEKRTYIRQVIDEVPDSFHWLVWEVSASGFFTDSYNLFATNVILPSLAYLYWPKNDNHYNESLINIMSLLGTLLGQLLFGYLADRFGRTRLYGIELLVVIVTTLTVCASSTGIESINIVHWIMAMRFAMGIGIGGEYPLSAAICTEWAPTQARARMMAAVFSMQPLGQLVAQLIGLAVLVGYDRSHHPGLQSCTVDNIDSSHCRKMVDGIWRWVIGVGTIPAIVAIIYRFRIKDPGLYDLDVKDQGKQAVENTERLYGRNLRESRRNGAARRNQVQRTDSLPVQLNLADMWEYFWDDGNWRLLAGTALCWFLLDVAFYGLGIGSPQILANIWARSKDDLGSERNQSWNPGLSGTPSIYLALRENAYRNIVTVCIPSLAGSLLVIRLIDYLPRKGFLILSFLSLSLLLFITSGVFFGVAYTDAWPATVVFVALCNFFFNFGANTLTFIIPAEIFPTSYRATCHGIAAACGKLGSVIMQASLQKWEFPGDNGKSQTVTALGSHALGYILILYACIMVLAALFAWAWIPDVQGPRSSEGGRRLPNKTIEELAEGVQQYRADGQVIGMRDNLLDTYMRLRRRVGRNQPRQLDGQNAVGEGNGQGEGNFPMQSIAGA